MTKSHDSQSGEAGHQGSDRQAGKHLEHANQANPEPKQAANASQVKSRSSKAGAARQTVDAPDHLHPGPNRAESEKSLGAIHDPQRKAEDMNKEFKKI
jgi:hypothetical protein